MEKIPSLIVNGQFDPAHDWVLRGKGTATQMYDGLCYAVIDSQPYRHIVTPTLTEGVMVASIHEGHIWGWEPVPEEDERFWECWHTVYDSRYWDWSYELVGPTINGDPEQAGAHVLKAHGKWVIRSQNVPTIEGLQA